MNVYRPRYSTAAKLIIKNLRYKQMIKCKIQLKKEIMKKKENYNKFKETVTMEKYYQCL